MEHISKAQIKWVRSLQQKKFRLQEHVFVAEGDKCINELKEHFRLRLYISPANASEIEIKQVSSLQNPQGSIAVFDLPEPCPLPKPDRLLVALDGVQDPGNMGTILRTCDWFGIRDVVCSRQTADCFSPKVVQATMGALARVRVHYIDGLADWLETCRQQDVSLPIYGTLLNGRNMFDNESIPSVEKGIIVMGNEGNGLTEAVRLQVTHPLYIPSGGSEAVESLNVGIATGIVLAEFLRRKSYL